MKERRVAANLVYINSKEFHKYHIVELFDNIVVNHYGLQEELAMTEWLGGTILLTHARDFDTEGVNSIEEFYAKADAWDEKTGSYYAYHINRVLSPSAKFRTDDGSGNGNIQRL